MKKKDFFLTKGRDQGADPLVGGQLETIFSLSCTEISLTGTVYAQQIHTFRTAEENRQRISAI